MKKKRTLNELRQVKDVVYKNPRSSLNKRSKVILELIETYPNDAELGNAIRKLFRDEKK
tara:strand:+ start:378 stop:554 length:177 start_codon:yes stop_codon:yes gene_type:complete